MCPRGAIAQLGERLDRTQEVAGSSPASSTIKGPGDRAFLVSGHKVATTLRDASRSGAAGGSQFG
jgi:hypothetical protein